jgi:hypothetical protein
MPGAVYVNRSTFDVENSSLPEPYGRQFVIAALVPDGGFSMPVQMPPPWHGKAIRPVRSPRAQVSDVIVCHSPATFGCYIAPQSHHSSQQPLCRLTRFFWARCNPLSRTYVAGLCTGGQGAVVSADRHHHARFLGQALCTEKPQPACPTPRLVREWKGGNANSKTTEKNIYWQTDVDENPF